MADYIEHKEEEKTVQYVRMPRTAYYVATFGNFAQGFVVGALLMYWYL